LSTFISKRFLGSFKSTIGADFLTQEMWVDDKLVTLQIWDTAGQERFNSLGRVFYRGSDCCFLVFDVMSAKSLKELKYWKTEFTVHSDIKDAESFPFVIIANRIDCNESEREVSTVDAHKWASQNGNISVFETSAKTGVGVEKAFESAVKLVLQKRKDKEAIPKIHAVPIQLGGAGMTEYKSDGPCESC